MPKKNNTLRASHKTSEGKKRWLRVCVLEGMSCLKPATHRIERRTAKHTLHLEAHNAMMEHREKSEEELAEAEEYFLDLEYWWERDYDFSPRS